MVAVSAVLSASVTITVSPTSPVCFGSLNVARIKGKIGSPYSVIKNFPKGNWLALDTLITVNGSVMNITPKTLCYGNFYASSSKYRDSVST